MIKSMTGFGRCEAVDGQRRFTVEIKSVNHRYLDIAVKLPKRFGMFEPRVRSLLKGYMERGKADVYLSCEEEGGQQFSIKYNASLAGQYLMYAREMAGQLGIEDDIRASTLSRFPEVFVMEEREALEQDLWPGLETALRGAAERLNEARAAEGEQLRADLMGKLRGMHSQVDFIEERYPVILKEYRGRLENKVRELLLEQPLDDARIAAETVIFADKICVDEETVRLRSHIKAMETALGQGGAVGRRLDFIAQEMNREANTILSKANDLAVTDAGISLKTDIEKIREQIQNIE